MKFGVQFFPDVKPEEKSAAEYFGESLDLVVAAEPLGYTHVRIVEHYFHPYGGYSPNPIVFLSAASQRNRTARMVTGCIMLLIIPRHMNGLGELFTLCGIDSVKDIFHSSR